MKAHWIKDAVLAVICLILVVPTLIYGFPFLISANHSYTVMSGSMSPALIPGDLVIVKEDKHIDIGDIVTVESGEFIYTHRVVEKLEGDRFRLKGDANEEPDQGLIEASQIIGKVILVFPFGYLYTPYGFALALLAPAALIIGNQMHTIYQHTKRRNKRETMRWRRKSHSALGTTTLLLALILTVSTTRVIAPHFIAGISSYFSDVEETTGFFQAGIWVFPCSITCLAEPPTFDLGYSVIISGSLQYAHDAVVTIEYQTAEGSWTLIDTTDAVAGSYSYKWENIDVGSYDIRASWNGDTNHYGDTSETVTVVVS